MNPLPMAESLAVLSGTNSSTNDTYFIPTNNNSGNNIKKNNKKKRGGQKKTIKRIDPSWWHGAKANLNPIFSQPFGAK